MWKATSTYEAISKPSSRQATERASSKQSELSVGPLTLPSMEIAIIVAVFGVAALFVLLFLAKRMLRFAVRLMLLGLLAIILIAGGLFWWWYHSGNTTEQD